jgi:L-fuconolactonase
MRIDCRVSLCDRAKFTYKPQPHRDYSADDLGMILSRNRFEGAVAVAQLDDPEETTWLLDMARQHRWLLGVVTQSEDARWLDQWQRCEKLVGVDCAGAPEDARALAARGLTCVTNSVTTARAALEGAPELRVVLRALSGVSFQADEFAAWAKEMEAASGLPVVAQIDGLLDHVGDSASWKADTYRPWIQHLLNCFGTRRLVFGSGWPQCMPRFTWKESLACFTQAMGARTIEERSAMLGENACEIYDLRPGVGYTVGS